MIFRFLLLVLCTSSLIASASEPIDFTVAPDKASFAPAHPFRTGDRLYVQSPWLYGDDLVALARCRDADCTDLDVVRVWTARRSGHVRDYVNIQQDGDYIFFANTVPPALPSIERHGCFRSAPLNKVCSGSRRLAITAAKSSPDLFRVRFSTGSWIWVRKVRSAAG